MAGCSIHSSCLQPLGELGLPEPQTMSSHKDLCCPRPSCCPDVCPQPYVDAWNQPCVTSCGDSSAVVYPPPVIVRFPGPILATCPQESFVGTSLPNVPYGYGGSYAGGNFGGSVSAGSVSGGTYGGLYSYGKRYDRKCYPSRFGGCGPC
nr:claw keratin-like [Pelodiscus sinensis]|eukprot:XP_014435935.1 claw keratin-like [Pelodiscus sinensis]